MKRVVGKAKQFDLFDASKKVFLVVLALLLVDVAVAFLGRPYLSENIGTFIGKTSAGISSDLLFMEGCVALAGGLFIAVATLWRRTPSPETESDQTKNKQESEPKSLHPSVLGMIIGAVLILLSVIVGTFFS